MSSVLLVLEVWPSVNAMAESYRLAQENPELGTRGCSLPVGWVKGLGCGRVHLDVIQGRWKFGIKPGFWVQFYPFDCRECTGTWMFQNTPESSNVRQARYPARLHDRARLPFAPPS